MPLRPRNIRLPRPNPQNKSTIESCEHFCLPSTTNFIVRMHCWFLSLLFGPQRKADLGIAQAPMGQDTTAKVLEVLVCGQVARKVTDVRAEVATRVDLRGCITAAARGFETAHSHLKLEENPAQWLCYQSTCSRCWATLISSYVKLPASRSPCLVRLHVPQDVVALITPEYP